MATNYTINWSNGTLKPSFALNAGTVNTSTSSLTLTGKGRSNWGETLQENLLHLMEHFASPTSPSNPTIGQMWFNSDKKVMYAYYDSGWKPCGVTVATTAPLTPGEGTIWWNSSANELSVNRGSNNWDLVITDTNILTQITNLGFATETWVHNNFISNSELTAALGDYVTLTGVQTVSNKTLTAPTLTGTTSAATITTTGNVTVGNNLNVTGTANLNGGATVATGLTVSSGGATITSGGLTVSSGGATVTGASTFSSTVTAAKFISDQYFVAQGSTTQGGQMILGFKNNDAVTSLGPSQWSVDVDGGNQFRIYVQHADNTVDIPLTINESATRLNILSTCFPKMTSMMFDEQAAAPTAVQNGQLYFNDNSKLYLRSSGNWRALATETYVQSQLDGSTGSGVGVKAVAAYTAGVKTVNNGDVAGWVDIQTAPPITTTGGRILITPSAIVDLIVSTTAGFSAAVAWRVMRTTGGVTTEIYQGGDANAWPSSSTAGDGTLNAMSAVLVTHPGEGTEAGTTSDVSAEHNRLEPLFDNPASGTHTYALEVFVMSDWGSVAFSRRGLAVMEI